MEQVLGSATGAEEGPTVVGIGGLHGNEPAGVWALEAVLNELQRSGRGLLRGRFVALVGNRPALRAGTRFLDRDLNRIWTEGPAESDTEGREQAGLERTLEELRPRGASPTYMIDLHTTSGDAPPFTVLGDMPANREFGRVLPVPLVLGLSGHIEGTLLEYLDRRGWVTVGFESGSHRGQRSIAMAASAVWLLLHAAGLLGETDSRLGAARTRLLGAGSGFPQAVEVFHRHPVTSARSFQMVPGFRSFQPVPEGELLAREGGDEVRAPSAGRLLMPLYQPSGEDGFFLARTAQVESSVKGSLGLSPR